MSLKIQNAQGTFDLPPDYNIEIEDTSPIYNERGSQSVAATLPSSRNNLRLTNHIHRLDTDQVPAQDSRVTVSDGAYRRIGKMNITQASRISGIVSNIGFDESEMYSIWNAVSLRSLKDLPIYKAANGAPDIITYLDEIMNEKRTDTPFHVFPICVSLPSRTENGTLKFYPEYLNSTIKKNAGTGYSLNGNARTETYLLNNEPVVTSLPAAYGITPFLKVSWILDTLFTYYGYKVTENPFATHPQLSRLVVLNNSADCGVKGFIDYTDLMPDCTINEFLQSLYCRFGMLYFVDGKTKTVRFKFLRDIISKPALQDWSNLKTSELTINYASPKQLKLSAGTSISGSYPEVTAAPTSDTLDKLLKPYQYIVADKYEDGYLSYAPHLGLYALRRVYNQKVETVSSDFFPWDKGDNIAYEEISSVDESLPIKTAHPDNGNTCPAYLLGKSHRYTNIATSDVELSEERNTQTPLCFCFSLPITATPYPYGSPRCLGPYNAAIKDTGGHLFDISLVFVGENGLFNRFWKEYDAILRHASHSIESELHLSHNQLLNSDFASPIGIDGQRLLIDSFRYALPLRPTYPATVSLRTLKLLKPYDLDKEQQIPIIKQQYKWVLINNRESITNSVIADQVRKWQTGLLPPATWLGVNRKNEVSDSVSESEIPFTVPTKDDFDNNHTPFIKKVNYSFDLYYKVRVQTGTTTQGYPIYKEEEYGGRRYDIQYNLWIKAESL